METVLGVYAQSNDKIDLEIHQFYENPNEALVQEK
jgi:hypothetical protein